MKKTTKYLICDIAKANLMTLPSRPECGNAWTPIESANSDLSVLVMFESLIKARRFVEFQEQNNIYCDVFAIED